MLFGISKIESRHSSQAINLFDNHINQSTNQPHTTQPTQTQNTMPSFTKTPYVHPNSHNNLHPHTNNPPPAAVPAPARSSKSNKPRSTVSAPTTPPATPKASAPARLPLLPTRALPASVRTLKTTIPALRASRASLCLLSLMERART